MLRPFAQFCCGCPMWFGGYVILFINLLFNVFYIGTATFNIILKIPSFGFSTSLTQQTFSAAFALLGLPFIVAGFWGISQRLEGHLRLYLLYAAVGFTLDMIFILLFFATSDVCFNMPSALRRHGAAFACGFMRIAAIGGTVGVTVIQIYFLFCIWSLCEDMKAGGSDSGLTMLLKGQRDMETRRKFHQAYSETLFNSNGNGPFPIMYGAFSSPGMGGSSRIFNGHYHETQYPPGA